MTTQSEFDPAYAAKLKEFLNGKYNGTVQDLNSAKVTNNKKKLIFHLKHHIDNGNNPPVEFNNDYSKFRVYDTGTQTEARRWNFNPLAIDPDIWIITTKQRGYARIMEIEKPEPKTVKRNKKQSKKTNDTEYTEARIEY